MATASQALAVAASQLGYSRWTDEAQGTRYGRWYAASHGADFGKSGVPYCAMFVSWVLAQVGMTPPGGHFAYVPFGISAARRAGRLVSHRSAAPGDLVCFDWNGDGVADHVGFVELNRGAHLQTIEGNTTPGVVGSQSDGGGVHRRTRAWGDVIAVIRPAYASSPAARPASAPDRAGLAVDGAFGPATVRRLQEVLGTTADGVVSGQSSAVRPHHPAAVAGAWRYDGGGSQAIAALQRRLGVTDDGYCGPATITAWQRRLGVTADGYLGPATTRAVQSALNRGSL